MSDLKDKNIISEYLVYADENCNKLRGNANFYEASESLRIYCDEEWFLIVDSWDFIRELNGIGRSITKTIRMTYFRYLRGFNLAVDNFFPGIL